MASSYPSSDAWWDRARRVIPGGTQTISKSAHQWGDDAVPLFVQRARGGHVWDVDGNEWVDFPMALGPVLLGHAEPAVDEAIVQQLRDGISYTLGHPLEVEVAERIVGLCPGVEAVRFAKTGSDVTSAAVRLARAHTARERVLVCGYHGWHDWYAASTDRIRGVPSALRDLVAAFPFNDLDRLERELSADDVAAVVIEPSGAVLPAPGYLSGVVALCRRYGAVSVFDELITGFRIAPGGARQRYGAIADLSCYGKALGNGMPISALAGNWSVMSGYDDVLISGTHGGEALSLAAARVVLDTVADGQLLADIAATGAALQAELRGIVDRHGVAELVTIGGEPSRPVMSFGPDGLVRRSWVQQCMAEDGVLFTGSFNLCARHSPDDVARALHAFDRACAGIGGPADELGRRLKGRPVRDALRPT